MLIDRNIFCDIIIIPNNSENILKIKENKECENKKDIMSIIIVIMKMNHY